MGDMTTKLAYTELAKLQRRAEFGGGGFQKAWVKCFPYEVEEKLTKLVCDEPKCRQETDILCDVPNCRQETDILSRPLLSFAKTTSVLPTENL